MDYVNSSAQVYYEESQYSNPYVVPFCNRNSDIQEIWYGKEVTLSIGDQLITLSTPNEYYNDGLQGFSGYDQIRFLTETEESLFKIALQRTGKFLD